MRCFQFLHLNGTCFHPDALFSSIRIQSRVSKKVPNAFVAINEWWTEYNIAMTITPERLSRFTEPADPPSRDPTVEEILGWIGARGKSKKETRRLIKKGIKDFTIIGRATVVLREAGLL